MLQQWSSLCSPSYSYLINYKIQSTMYNWLDENTEETEYLTSSGMGVWCASNVITSIARVVGIAEVFFQGSCLFFSAPFVQNSIHTAKLGLHEIFIHTSKNILRTTSIPLEFLVGAVKIIFEPKSFTMEMAECMRVNLLHANKGTIHSIAHQKDLNYVSGVVKPKFMEYQERRWVRLESKV